MKRISVLFFLLISINYSIGQKVQLTNGKDSIGIITLNYKNYNFNISATNFLESIREQNFNLPDSIINRIEKYKLNSLNKLPINLNNPEDGTFIFDEILFHMILNKQVVSIINTSTMSYISYVKVKKKKCECYNKSWIWKGKSIIDSEGNELFYIITERRWLNCGFTLD